MKKHRLGTEPKEVLFRMYYTFIIIVRDVLSIVLIEALWGVEIKMLDFVKSSIDKKIW